MTDDRGQMTEDRWQRTDDRGQRTDDRWRRTDDRRQMTEVRWQKTDDGGQNIECGNRNAAFDELRRDKFGRWVDDRGQRIEGRFSWFSVIIIRYCPFLW